MTDSSRTVPLADVKHVRIRHLQEAKRVRERFVMLTAYEQYAAEIFDQAGIDVLLVGDSASNNVYGHKNSIPVTLDQLIPLCAAVTRSVQRPLVVADLPFGSFEVSTSQAVESSVRLMKEGLAHAVKMESTKHFAPHVSALTNAGIPVMAHIGFTAQREHQLGGYRVQGRGDDAKRLMEDALALQEAGAFCLLMEMIPEDVATGIDAAVDIPTIGIGAGASTTGQVLVWQDMAGLGSGKPFTFVKQYANLREDLTKAAQAFAKEVRQGAFPTLDHTF
ncbi:3-methyl-2-oxobutanoate hydroxymethyltransferase [Arthrobacter sp. EH-1B-1]|uniref:3-methyl-2-oxobutanoate hydroxymethyltransferase n=1 Tax=Arthrobacter vasquezii TaxID=2977629 RepID=A0ABT6D2G5_9MICC|nr:3-methyl-2-oxobutanoate hydroxymethyltransferase [Arthrobacter vasquezii]MDF9279642.1 3-methyl-2-oxobutanoate hydroxymethyltransferase [Arthrobacter vasquezii]